MAFIRFESGPLAGELVALDKKKVVFGRQPSCDCVLKHPTVSREHFCIEHNGGKYFVVDQNSGNGTFANGERVSWLELKDGDTIQAGPFTMTVELSGLPDLGAKALAEQARDESPGARAQVSQQFSRDYPREYLAGIEHFNAGRYFEAHEVWEDIWLRSIEDTRLFYQMLIQAAVGLHHYERGNSRGGRGMYRNVVDKLARLPKAFMSLDLVEFARDFKEFFADLIENDNEAPPPPNKTRPSLRLLDGGAE